MSILATPPRPTLGQHAPTLPADVLAALEGDSDEDNDHLPLSLYFKPDELLDSPDKQAQQQRQLNIRSHSSNLLSDLSNNPSQPEPISASRSSSSLSRSASVVQTQPQPRTFTRVASVPSNGQLRLRESDASPTSEDHPQSNRPRRSGSQGSDKDAFEPETPASSNYLPRRPFTTNSRPTFPSKQTTRSDLSTVTPGLTSRYKTASSTSSKYLPVRRTVGTSGSANSPESDSGTDRPSKESSPIPSPRTSPSLHSQQTLSQSSNTSSQTSSAAARNRLTSGRLGAPARGRVGTLVSSVADVVSERDEEYEATKDIDALEKERSRLSMERRERESEWERVKEKERLAESEREEHERSRDANEAIVDRVSDVERYRDNRGSVSPSGERISPVGVTQSVGRSRAASSSEHHSSVQPRELPRAASAMDHYHSSRNQSANPNKFVGVARVETKGGPLRNGQTPQTIPESSDGMSSNPARPGSSRARNMRPVSGNPSMDTVRPSPPSTSSQNMAPLSRQASEPVVYTNSTSLATPSSSTAYISATTSLNPSRHRRNPTAPSPPTTSSRLRRGPSDDMVGSQNQPQYLNHPENQKENRPGGTHVNGNGGDDHGRLREISNKDKDSEKQAPSSFKDREEKDRAQAIATRQAPPSTQQPVQTIPTHYQPPPQTSQSDTMPKRPTITVNRKVYQRLDCIGRGGSSRVYRVISPENAIYAIKRVSLENADQQTIEGYKNEIALLRRLEGNRRIIRLVEFDSTSSKKNLLMVMECGEVDLAKLLSEKQGEPIDFPWVTSQWQQMLQAVHVIHEEKIVHSDLKPANFVMVKGSLKLIDFGIAKAIPNDTTNIQREQQIGTVNYMSPEAIEGTHGMSGFKIMKLGRASDVWSLGCILYQMIYGQPPFYFLTMWQKMKAIPDLDHEIDLPAVAVPSLPGPRDPQTGAMGPPRRLVEHATPVPSDVIQTIRNCLLRDPKKRPSIPELMQERWNMRSDISTSSSPSRPSSPSSMLKSDEAIIDANKMAQLLTFAYANPPSEINQVEIMRMVEGLLPALQNARKHRS